MRQLRRIHKLAAFVTTASAGLAAGGWPAAAFVLIVLSMLLIIWSLEQLRAALTRSPKP